MAFSMVCHVCVLIFFSASHSTPPTVTATVSWCAFCVGQIINLHTLTAMAQSLVTCTGKQAEKKGKY